MKFRLLCLILALAMLLPVALTGCSGNNDSSEDLENIEQEASETTVSLRMYMITEDHVPTKEEVDAVKAEKGEKSKEYIEIKAKKDAYDNVAAALDKITKAKFRTHLETIFYTEEEYRAVEEIMAYQAGAAERKEAAKTALKKFTAQQVAFGYTDEAEIKNKFYQKYPEYAEFANEDAVKDTEKTEIETIVNSYGITELKYPELGEKQVDIICIVGYDNYLRYIENGWLSSEVEGELDGSSKAIKTYVNEKFLAAAASNADETIYAVPNNKPIGEYTYLLLHKELYAEFQYDYEEVTSVSNIVDFLKDVSELRDDYVPITGELDIVNTFFWSLDYEYVVYNPYGLDLSTESAAIDVKEELDSSRRYYIRELVSGEGSTAKYNYKMITLKPMIGRQYYTVNKATQFTGDAFESGVFYYTKESDGGYVRATEFVEGNTYYTLTFTETKVSDNEDDAGEFKDGVLYYTKNSDGTYSRVYCFVSGETYYVVETASFNNDTFSILGAAFASSPSQGSFVSAALMNSSFYKSQALVLKQIDDEGYHVAWDDLNGKKFASAVVKGGAALAAEYGDEYHLIVLEYPKAQSEQLCQNLIGVSSSCKNVERAMEVITYINTNADFRNLLQYGIEGINYKLVNIVENGKTYPTVHRLNTYYNMDIYKTGNTFIAYPEETMDYKAWDYGKLQNSQATYDPMLGFELSAYVDSIDFSAVDYFKELSAKYKERMDNCQNVEELEALFTQIVSELKQNTMYSQEIVSGVKQMEGSAEAAPLGNYNPFGVYHNYVMWWTPLYYVELDD